MKRVHLGWLAIAATLFGGLPDLAQAQIAPAPVRAVAQSPALDAELDRAFQLLLRDPANLDLKIGRAHV